VIENLGAVVIRQNWIARLHEGLRPKSINHFRVRFFRFFGLNAELPIDQAIRIPKQELDRAKVRPQVVLGHRRLLAVICHDRKRPPRLRSCFFSSNISVLAAWRSVVRMAFRSLPSHPSPKECGVMAVNVGGVIWVVSNAFDKAQQQVE
jgi:hypothetical protein